MQIGTFRKNVMKTVAVKPAKMGLRQVSRNTARTNITLAAVGLKAAVGHLVDATRPYILGEQWKPEIADAALSAYGDIGYHVLVLARTLKLKTPTATKKIKLQGTRTDAILRLDSLSTEIIDAVRAGIVSGPAQKSVQKEVVLPNKGGAKETRDVLVVDAEAEAQLESARQESVKTALAAFVDIYWRLSLDMFKQPPAIAFSNRFARMQTEYPTIEFDLGKAPSTKPGPKAVAKGKTPVAKGKKAAAKQPEMAGAAQ